MLSLFKKICAAVLLTLSCHASFAACAAQEISGASGESYVLKNSCAYSINIKYVFDESRPFSGTYSTLRPGEKTLDTAKTSENARYYECRFPGVPQTMSGGCVGGASTQGNFGQIKPSDQAEKKNAASPGCAVQEFSDTSGESYVLKNSCAYSINIKYVFDKSRPFSGTYTTLRPGEKTFDAAKTSETARYYECRVPGIPQTINGICAGGKDSFGNYRQINASDEAEKKKIAEEEKKRQTEKEAATEEARKQQAEIESLVNSAKTSGSLKPDYSKVAPDNTNSMSMTDAVTQLMNMKAAQQTADNRPQQQPSASRMVPLKPVLEPKLSKCIGLSYTAAMECYRKR